MLVKSRFAYLLVMITVAGCAKPSAEYPIYNPVDFGAKPDGRTISTAAIQKSIDECAANGGGVVQLTGGVFVSGTIFMKSGVTLDISVDATLLGSTNLRDYPITVPAYSSYTNYFTDKSLVYGENLSNIAVTGKGTIDGQGANFKGEGKHRPYGIRFITCSNVTVENLTLKNSAAWMQHYLACDNVSIKGITVWNHANRNNDMMDIDGCHNVLVTDCVGDTDDDGITLKSTSQRACENISIMGCTISSHCNAIKCGTESNGGFKNVKVSHCVIKPSAKRTCIFGHPEGLAGIALEIVDGGTMDRVSVSDVQIQGTLSPIFLRLGDRARRFRRDMPRPDVGVLRNVTISRVTASGASSMGCAIAGLKNHRIENLFLSDLNFTFAGGGVEENIARRFDEKPGAYPECKMFSERLPAYGLFLWHVDGLSLDDVKLTTVKPDERPAIVLEDVANLSIDGESVDNPKKLPQSILLVNGQQTEGRD